MDLDDAAVRELVDARAIEHLMVRYFDAVDALDPFAAVEIFTDDIEGDFMTGKVYRGPRAVARALGKILLQYEHTSHHITNHRATITGDTATALTYIYAFHRMRASEDTWHLWARHVDQLVRTADGWRVRHRVSVRRRLGAAVVEDRRLVVLRASRPSGPRRARATARRVERPTVTGERRRAAEVFDFAGRVVWVTGSSRGIGAGIARHLADHGATVVVHGRKPGSTDAVLADLRGATAVVGDVRDPEAVSAAVDVIAARHGRLDGVVANVGGAAPGRLDDTDPARSRASSTSTWCPRSPRCERRTRCSRPPAAPPCSCRRLQPAAPRPTSRRTARPRRVSSTSPARWLPNGDHASASTPCVRG